MSFLDVTVIKKKKLDKETMMTVSKNGIGKRIFVDFYTIDGKLRVQKSFPDNGVGERDSKQFQKQIKSTMDLMNYLGIKVNK